MSKRKKCFACLMCSYIPLFFIVWNYACSNQNMKSVKHCNHLNDVRQLMRYQSYGSLDKNQKRSEIFKDQNENNPLRSLYRNVTELRRLKDLVQRRLFYLQNPKNCTAAKKVVCKPNKHGFGSSLHQLTFCLIVAYATERTLVLESKGWVYAREGWETMFLPVSSNCTSTMNNNVTYTNNLNKGEQYEAIELPMMQRLLHRPDFMPFAIPEDIADRLERVHNNPAVWWIGQFVNYLIRPNKVLNLHLKKQQEKLRFRRPVVGLHVRRTDKIKEADLFRLKEYMEHAEKWYNQHFENSTQPRTVFIATDSPNVIVEAKREFPNYTFLYHKEELNMTKRHRYSTQLLKGFLSDVNTLVMCDFVVCTMSSNVCRLIHELRESRDGSTSEQMVSLDSDYFFNQKFPAKKLQRSILHNSSVGVALKDFAVVKDKRKNTKKPLFTSDKPRSRVVMPNYPEVMEDK